MQNAASANQSSRDRGQVLSELYAIMHRYNGILYKDISYCLK